MRVRSLLPRNVSAFTLLIAAAAMLWLIPFAWMAVAAMRPQVSGAMDVASLWPSGPFTMENFREAWTSGHFPLWYFNTIVMCAGILVVQCITVSLAGYAFARLDFPFRGTIFTLFLLQLLLPPAVLVVPNLLMVTQLGLQDTLLAVMAPYFASAFGVFLMRQTFRSIPRDFEDAAMVDGANRLQVIWHVLLPLARPGLAAFSVISVTSHWNEYLWPLMAVSSPNSQVLTVGLASFTSGAEAGSEWGVVAAGTALVAGPLLLAFLLFQRRFVSSLVFTGLK
jgi:sn-glycerol 3-phosphate transport system permease protein